MHEAEQHPDQRRLARAVRAQQPEPGTLRHVQIDAVDGRDVPEPLGQPRRADGAHRRIPGTSSDAARSSTDGRDGTGQQVPTAAAAHDHERQRRRRDPHRAVRREPGYRHATGRPGARDDLARDLPPGRDQHEPPDPRPVHTDPGQDVGPRCGGVDRQLHPGPVGQRVRRRERVQPAQDPGQVAGLRRDLLGAGWDLRAQRGFRWCCELHGLERGGHGGWRRVRHVAGRDLDGQRKRRATAGPG